MNADQLQKLTLQIQQIMPELVNEWNLVKLPAFEALVEQPFETYFEGRQTQEKTKMVAPILDVIFARLIKRNLPEFIVAEGKGMDYMYGTVPVESKITFGTGRGWTGNGYKKTPWHLLMRFELTDQGVIISKFAAMVDLDNCKSKWTAPGSTSNFSTLEFVAEDFDKLIPVVGSISNKTSTGRQSVKLNIIMESV